MHFLNVYSKGILISAVLWFALSGQVNGMDIIRTSRSSCVEISSKSGNSRGTGFLIDVDHVATCFHVIAALQISSTLVEWSLYPDLEVKFNDGEVVSATVASIPSQNLRQPLDFDFAILKLSKKPRKAFDIVTLSSNTTSPDVGSEIIFSGYPLNTPAMVTHKGMVSGVDPGGNIICLEAPINKGNSGGAVFSQEGTVIGIVDMREGGVSKPLQDLREQIKIASQRGTVQLMGVDPLLPIGSIIDTLDKYISTGIGYAVSIKHLRDYIKAHSEVLR